MYALMYKITPWERPSQYPFLAISSVFWAQLEGSAVNHRHRWLLRAYCERPHSRSAAEQRDEVASLHVWMAPAWQEEM
jgi:hypothetical protein